MISPNPVGRQQLFLALQARIEQGQYAPGAWLPAERALAEEFGLDRSAIRSALRQLEDLGLIVRETGKRPWVRGGQPGNRQAGAGEGARQASAVELRTIVAILPQHPLYPASLAIMHGINATLRSTEAPFRLQIIDTHGGSEIRETSLEKKALDSVVREKIAGVVLWHMGGAETLPQLRQLDRLGIPVVFVDRFPDSLPCDFVGGDNHAGIEAGVEYLRHLGHRRIAHLTTDEQSTAVLERLAAYNEVILTVSSTPRREWVFQVSHNDPTNVSAAYDHFFALDEPPTAVVTLNDALAYHFIAECQKRGKAVPEEISVIGFDDLEQHSPRPALLTTLHQPFDKMGRRAADLLLRRLAGPDTAQDIRRHILLPTPLIKRSTCQPPAGK
ncbi:MAG: GntR family transcriptional regulator [Janthinobacterium lividum]